MGFAEAWRRRVLAAAGAGAAGPVLVVGAALLVGVGGGGLGGVGALSQVLEGPRVPLAVTDPDAGRRPGERDTERLLASVRPGPARAGHGGATAPGGGGDGRGRRRDGGDGGSGPDPVAPPPAAPPAPAPAPPAGPSPAPPSEPSSLVRQVGDQVTAVTDPVPIIGPPAGQVVDTLVEAVEALPPAAARD
jgi:hypothetical protein